MANVDKIDSIVDKSVLTDIATLEGSLKNLNATMIASLDTTIKLATEFKNATGIKEIVELNNKYNQSSQELIKFDKERAQLQQKLAEANERLRVSEESLQNARKKSETAKLTAEERELNAQRNAAEKQAAKQAIAERQLDDILKKAAVTKGEAARQNVILTQASKGVNVTTEEGIKKLKEINAVIDKNNAIIQANSDNLTKQKMNVGNYTQSIKDAAAQLKNSVSPAGLAANGISGVGTSLKGLATASTGFIGVGLVAAIGAIKGVVSSLNEEINKALAKESSVARFNNTLANMGHTDWAKDLKNSMKDLKTQYQSLSGIDLTSATQKLVTYGKLSKDQIQSLLPVIVNFAANARIGMDEATVNIIKGLEGQGRALKMYGLDLKSGGSDIDNYNQVLNVLGQKVEGSAKTFDESSEGAIAKQNRKLGEIKTTIGTQVLPMYVAMIETTTKFTSALAAIPIKAVVVTLSTLLGLFAMYQLSLFRTNLLIHANTEGTILNIIATKAKAAATGIATVATTAYTGATAAATGATGLFSAATAVLNAIWLVSPLFWIVATITGIVAGMIGLVSWINSVSVASEENSERIKRNTEEYKRNQEEIKRKKQAHEDALKIEKEANNVYQTQYGKIAELTKAVTDKTKTHKKQEEALKELIALDPKYLSGLTQQNIKTSEGIALLDKYRLALKSKAEMEAYAHLISSKYNEMIPKQIELQKEQTALSLLSSQRLQLAVAAGLPGAGKKEQEALAANGRSIIQLSKGITLLSSSVKEYDNQIDALNKKAPKAADSGVKFGGDSKFDASDDKKKSNKAEETEADRHAKRMLEIKHKNLENEAKLEDDAKKKALSELDAKYQKEKDALTKSGADKVKLSTKEQKEINDAVKTLDAVFEKEKLQIETDYERKRSETNLKNRIASVEKGSKEEMTAKLGLLAIQEAKEIEEAKKTGSSIEDVKAKYRTESLNAQRDYYKNQISLMDDEYSQEAAMRKEKEIEDLMRLEDMFNKGLISQQQYEDRKLSIISKSAINEAQMLIYLSKEKANLLDGKDRINALNKIALLEQQLSNKTTQVEIDNSKKSKDAKLKALKSQLDMAKDVSSKLTAFGAALYERQIDKIDKERSAYDAASEAKIAKIEDQESRGVISAETAKAQKKVITDAQAKYDEEADKKKTELKKKQAVLDKANALAQAAINVALGITGALPNIPLAAAVGILGAIEVATIIATPLAYAKGTPAGGHKGGSAIVGDGGKSEMLITSQGVFKTPDTPTFIPDLEKGAVVLPDFDKAPDFLLKASLNQSSASPIYDDRAMLGRIDSLGKDMKDIRTLLKMNLTKNGGDMDRLAYELYKNNALK